MAHRPGLPVRWPVAQWHGLDLWQCDIDVLDLELHHYIHGHLVANSTWRGVFLVPRRRDYTYNCFWKLRSYQLATIISWNLYPGNGNERTNRQMYRWTSYTIFPHNWLAFNSTQGGVQKDGGIFDCFLLTLDGEFLGDQWAVAKRWLAEVIVWYNI